MNILARLPLAALPLGLATLLSGCFLDAGPLKPDSAGGSAGASGAPATGGAGGTSNGGAGGTSSSGGAPSSGGTGGTGTQPMCSQDADCDDHLPCTQDACVAGACSSTPLPSGGDAPQVSPKDCKKQVCDGMGGVMDINDDTENPGMRGGDCFSYVCMGGAVVMSLVPDNTACGNNPLSSCHHFACSSGVCAQQNDNEGQIIVMGSDANCLDTVCMNGNLVSVPDWHNCNDNNPDNCYVPNCTAAGACVGGWGSLLAPAGYPCKDAQQKSGTCNGTDATCHT